MTDQAAETAQSKRFQAWADGFDTALTRLANKWRDLGVAAFLGAVAMLLTLLSFNFAHQMLLPDLIQLPTLTNWNDWWNGFFQNFGTEMFGALATFVLLQGIVGAREKADDRQLQEEIAQQIQNELRKYIQAQELARLRAAETQEERQPILDSMKATGLLEGAVLVGANLEEAYLQAANLQGARLQRAKLQGATMPDANLQGANLWFAKLLGVNLRFAKLERAKLDGANLLGALFLTADQLRSAETLQGATLPDDHQLPDDDTWQQAFEDWVENTAQLKTINGKEYIVPTRTEANAVWWDEYYGDGE